MIQLRYSSKRTFCSLGCPKNNSPIFLAYCSLECEPVDFPWTWATNNAQMPLLCGCLCTLPLALCLCHFIYCVMQFTVGRRTVLQLPIVLGQLHIIEYPFFLSFSPHQPHLTSWGLFFGDTYLPVVRASQRTQPHHHRHGDVCYFSMTNWSFDTDNFLLSYFLLYF